MSSNISARLGFNMNPSAPVYAPPPEGKQADQVIISGLSPDRFDASGMMDIVRLQYDECAAYMPIYTAISLENAEGENRIHVIFEQPVDKDFAMNAFTNAIEDIFGCALPSNIIVHTDNIFRDKQHPPSGTPDPSP